MFFTEIFLATILLSTATAFEQECFFPEPARDFDAYKLHGTTWYTGLQTNDAVASNMKCERARNFTETSYGFRMDLKTFKKRHNHIEWVEHFTFLRSGVYRESKVEDDFSMNNAYSFDENGQFNSAANSIVENVLLERDFAYISDYLNYWMAILCSAEGQWIVWVYFPTKTPNLTNIAAAYNELQRMGVSTQLHASQCDKAH
ncbi:uncharacterized protein LOC144432403 [Styela clava]|uniref:uncharacterized protein LOC120334352 isoform X1 n=1 Tax=Styela clava TaxID=7725 RepID=UPI001939BB91|nr:uncharacterized protein LOC120334352 isoform X1 [Styela clava]